MPENRTRPLRQNDKYTVSSENASKKNIIVKKITKKRDNERKRVKQSIKTHAEDIFHEQRFGLPSMPCHNPGTALGKAAVHGIIRLISNEMPGGWRQPRFPK